MSNMSKTQNSSIWEVNTSIGKFTIYFPCAVFNAEDKFMYIPKAVRNFEFIPMPEGASETEQKKINALNSSALQKALNEAICFGTDTLQGRVDLDFEQRSVYVQ